MDDENRPDATPEGDNRAGEVLGDGLPAGAPPAVPGETLPVGETVDLSAYGGPPPVAPARPARGRRTGLIAAAAVAATVAGIAGAGAWAFSAMGGGSSAPADHVPATALAFASVDLDPAMSQKLGAIRFLQRMPEASAGLSEKSDLREWAYDRLRDGDTDAPPWQDVQSWMGRQAAFALLPGGTLDKPNVVVALEVRDESAATRALRELMRGDAHDESGFVVEDGWATIAPSTAAAEQAADAAADSPLSGARQFGTDMGRLGEAGITSAWADSAALVKEYGQKAASAGMGSDLSWLSSVGDGPASTAVTLRFTGNQLEVAGVSRGNQLPHTAGHGLADLPADTVVGYDAGELSGIADTLRKSADTALAQQAEAAGLTPSQMKDQMKEVLGIAIPDDLLALMSGGLRAAVFGPGLEQLQLGVRGWSTDPEGMSDVLDRVSQAIRRSGNEVTHTSLPDGWALGRTSRDTDAMSGKGGLGASARFQAVLPGSADATSSLYVDLERLSTMIPDTSDSAVSVMKALGAVGMQSSAPEGGYAAFSLRIGS